MHLLIQAELDGELDAAGAAMLFGHLEGCPDCTALRDRVGFVSTRLRGGDLTRHAAPAALRAVIVANLPAPLSRSGRMRGWRMGRSHAASFGAGLAVAAAMSWLMVVVPNRNNIVPDIVAAHIRALQPGHLLDVPSSDQHTVKPWFDGRLDFAPTVPDLAAGGFPLLGGRLDYLGGRSVAVLVYGRDKHVIDVFVRPDRVIGMASTVQGYNVLGWTRDGMDYEAVSDLNPVELAAFARLMAGAPATR